MAYTRSGVRRAGDRYQDLVAADLLLEMLEHPTRHSWIQVEADDVGALDDVLAQRADGQFMARQVKFSAHPDAPGDPWSWTALLKQEIGKSGHPTSSLLQKWSDGLTRLEAKGPVAEAGVYSNRMPGDDLKIALQPDGYVDFERVVDPETRAEIIRQLGSEEIACSFFKGFRFDLDRPHPLTLEHGLRRRFFALGGDEGSWLNLKDELSLWVEQHESPPPDGKITLSVARTAARWYRLQSLPEDFEVPQDYTLPSQDFHEEFKAAVLSGDARCVVLVGQPGLGKSTYLSFLSNQLHEEGQPVVRHHYFLSLGDRSVGRLEYARVAEALMSELERKLPEALGGVGVRNPSADELKEWLEACGRHLTDQGKRLVVVVDGLDHVWREQGSRDNLDKLFEHLLPPAEGVTIVLGTQPVDDEQLPSRLTLAAPRDSWHDLPPLDRSGVAAWLGHYREELGWPQDGTRPDHSRERLVTAFWERSCGHPLHMRYTLKALQERGGVVTTDAVRSLPGCPHDGIAGYYRVLWRGLSDAARDVLYLITAARYPWPDASVLDCLGPSGGGSLAYMGGLRQVRHLLASDPLGLRPFHPSLLAFVSSLDSYVAHVERMQRQALVWLRTRAPEYWKWAYEWLLCAELGDPVPLVNGPTREWVVDAVARRLPADEVDEILGRAAWHALQAGDLGRFVATGLLRDYGPASLRGEPEAIEMLLGPQIFVAADPHLRGRLEARLRDLSHDEVVTLGMDAAERGNQRLLDRCWHELIERQHLPPRGEFTDESADRKSLTDAILRLAPDRSGDTERIVNYALAKRESGRSIEILRAYCRAARATKAVGVFKDLLVAELDRQERDAVLRQAVPLMAREGVDLSERDLRQAGATGPLVGAYLALKALAAKTVAMPMIIQEPANEVLAAREYDLFSLRTPTADMFYDGFFFCLAHHLQGTQHVANAWLSSLSGHEWPVEALGRLNSIAQEIAAQLRNGEAPRMGFVYERLRHLSWPARSDDRPGHELGFSLREALQNICDDLADLATVLGMRAMITANDVDTASGAKFWNFDLWLTQYVRRRQARLTEDAVDWVFANRESVFSTVIEEFPSRAQALATLAGLASLHGRHNKVSQCVQAAADNIVAYGQHKDLLLHNALEVIERCHSYSAGDPRRCILDLAPAIAGVGQYTDGDETSHLPAKLGEVMAKAAPDCLPAYYIWLCEQEQYRYAEDVFHTMLRTADLRDPVSSAIAGTAADRSSLQILRDRAGRGDVGAANVLESLVGVLGRSVFESEPEEETNHSQTQYPQPASPEGRPDPAAYPPERLRAFLSDSKANYPHLQEECVAVWLDQWETRCAGRDILASVEELVLSGLRVGNSDRLFDLAVRAVGREAAYPWLVRAQREDHGWDSYWTAKKKAEGRWALVRDWYPERWLQFLQDSLTDRASGRWAGLYVHSREERLVEYCLILGKKELAAAMADQMIAAVAHLTSPAHLPTPAWVQHSG